MENRNTHRIFVQIIYMKMRIIKKRISNTKIIDCKIYCMGTRIEKDFFFRFESDKMSDKIEINFSEIEKIKLFNYLSQIINNK